MCNICGKYAENTVQRLVRVAAGEEHEAGMFKVLRFCEECAAKHGKK
jgi:hypothetical protein